MINCLRWVAPRKQFSIFYTMDKIATNALVADTDANTVIADCRYCCFKRSEGSRSTSHCLTFSNRIIGDFFMPFINVYRYQQNYPLSLLRCGIFSNRIFIAVSPYVTCFLVSMCAVPFFGEIYRLHLLSSDVCRNGEGVVRGSVVKFKNFFRSPPHR